MSLNLQQAKLDLLQEIKNYTPYDASEALDKERLINFLENNDKVHSRENLIGHLTSSSRIVNKDRTKTLLIHHNIYDCRAPLGGHADNNPNLTEVSIQEAQEESGIQNITLIQPDILDITVHSVVEHKKKGKIVPNHFHFDIRYLLEADENETLVIAEHEVSDVKRFPINEVQDLNIDIMPVVQRIMVKVH